MSSYAKQQPTVELQRTKEYTKADSGLRAKSQTSFGLKPLGWSGEAGSPQFGALPMRAPLSPRCAALSAASCGNHGAAPNFGTRVPGNREKSAVEGSEILKTSAHARLLTVERQ